MRGVAEKCLHDVRVRLEALHESVQRRQQLTHLGQHGAGDRAEVGLRPRTSRSIVASGPSARRTPNQISPPATTARSRHGQEGVGEDFAGERSTLSREWATTIVQIQLPPATATKRPSTAARNDVFAHSGCR